MSRISKEVEQFIETNVETVDQLRILLHLQNNPEQNWSADKVSANLRLNRDVVAAQLAKLAQRGLLSVVSQADAIYRYAPSTVNDTAMMGRLAQIDRELPVTLIKLIYAKARG